MAPIQFPATLGMDFSGVIEKVGEDDVSSSDLKQGDEVYGQAGVLMGGSGAFAEMALAKADTIAHKPRTLDHEQAAGLPPCRCQRLAGTCRNYWINQGSKNSDSWRSRRHRINCYPLSQASWRICSNNSEHKR